MARPKGSKNKPKASANGTAGEPQVDVGQTEGKNDLTEGERQTLALSWLKQYETTLAAKNKAASDHSNLCKRMKTEIGKDAVDLMKDMIAARSPEGEADLRGKIDRAMRAARYMAAPLGAQLEIFDEDRTPAVDRATAEGLRDGKLGVTAKPDYAPETEQFKAYMTAWHDGQKSIMDFQRMQDSKVFDAAETDEGDADTPPPAPGGASLQPQFEDDAPIGDQPATFETMN